MNSIYLCRLNSTGVTFAVYPTFTVKYFPAFYDVNSQQPSLNRKEIDIFQSLRIFKIFKPINSSWPSSLHIFQQFYVGYIFQIPDAWTKLK